MAQGLGGAFPWGTLFVNVLGSFVLGVVATLMSPDGRLFAGSEVRQFLIVGLCGGYTTFSSFSFETLQLLRDGEFFRAGGYIVLSVVVCLAAIWLGHVASAWLNQLKGS